MQRKIITTGDGAHSIEVLGTNEWYHSKFGAVLESHNVYIQAGLKPEVFRKLFNTLLSNSLVVAYCSKGKVKRAMQAAGFIVEKLQGPPGKSEMTRAIKTDNKETKPG